MALPRTLFAFSGVVLAALSVHGAFSPPVTVSLRSSFTASDPLLEAFEAIAMENPSVLFPLLSTLSLSEKPLTPKGAHQAIFNSASTYMDESTFSSARARLALHAATPRLTASAEHYDRHIANLTERHKLASPECASWVDWYSQVVCDAETLLQLATSQGDGAVTTKPQHLPFDHVHQLAPSLEEPHFTAIHYADPTASSFHSLHKTLLSLEPKVEYVLRWAKGSIEQEQGGLSNYLSGYGVALDLKKMDYLVLDDRNQLQGDTATQPSDESAEKGDRRPSNEEVISCIFDSLPYVDEAAEARAKESEPLSSEEIADLGLKAIQFMMMFSDPPRAGSLYVCQCWDNHHDVPWPTVGLFQTLTNSFPLYATSLARKIKISTEVYDEVYENWVKASQGVNMAWVNGRVINENEGSTGNIFGLLRTLQRERTLVKSLVDLGLTSQQAIEHLMHPQTTSREPAPSTGTTSKQARTRGSSKAFAVQDQEESEKRVFSLSPKFAEFLQGLVDASDRQEGGDAILYWNDMAADPRYAHYSPSLHELLRVHVMALFSPNLRIRQNLVNVIFVLDLSQMRSLSLLGSLSENFVARGYPVRWGFVPEGDGDSLRMARLVYYINRKYGHDRMTAFVQGISRTHAERRMTTLSWQIVHDIFRVVGADDEFSDVAGGNVPLTDETTGEDIIARSQKYVRRLGVGVQTASGKGHAFVNGRYIPVSDNIFHQMSSEITAHLQILQEMVYTGEIKDSDIPLISTFFYDLPSTLPRRNPYISVESSSGRANSLEGNGLQMFNLPELFFKAGLTMDGSFVVPDESDDLPITLYVIANFDSPKGVALAKESLRFLTTSGRSRLTFIHNSETMPISGASTLISTLLHSGSSNSFSPSRVLEAIDNALDEKPGPDTQKFFTHPLLGATEADLIRVHRTSRLLSRQLGLQPGQAGILVNGRLVGPFDKDSEFVAEDFEMLEEYEIKQRVGRVMDAVDTILGEDDTLDISRRANLVSMASSIIYADQQPDPSEAGLFDSAPKPRTQNYRLLSGNYTQVLKFTIGDPSIAKTHLALLVDPLSETAQRWSTILAASELFLNVYIEVYFNPVQHSEIPLKRFYRYNVLPHLQYDANGQEIPAQVTFNGLPLEPIYTLSMDVPPAWLVRPREALYDLDNIQLGQLSPEDKSRGVQALFALDYLVVEGHARELKTVNPPRGVQLQLIDTKDSSVIDDTQIVANLGYLQFKARPGTFRLEIREGRGREIYKLESVGSEGWNSLPVSEVGDELTVMSFDGLTLYPRLSRKPGMERMDVLDGLRTASSEESPSIMESWISKVSSLLKPKGEDKETTALQKQGSGQADINIFTVASGLLYERFASIMILSVLRNTKSSVKFWFIENFLSPTFLEFIPRMAEEYGFQYELVTYKWPSWLRAQKEKQRIIWAYKILFLDVLFPMDLKKVIFVDADQIVRADLQELVDLDLHGAPYGYTPMGDDNYDMEGFRFWKTGYWHDFLGDRSYHISALYVVDLVRFRQMAAGDLLRGSYQMLSQDPNSLANLDQDLPNNLQSQVPIYSLDEDWLWCETWCSKDRLSRAKTIDLCQNPLTKEPKLSRARQIPEWEEYDNEIAQFVRKLAAEGKIAASVATADSNVLAGSNSQARSPSIETTDESSQASHPHDEL